MRGSDVFMENLFTMRTLEDFVPSEHPLRPIREMVNAALKRLDELFDRMYAAPELGGRPSIAPEKLLRAMLLQVFYSIRSERQLMEQVQYNLLFRWFIGLSMDDAVWTPTVFTKNRERLIDHEAVVALFNEVLAIAASRDWLSGEHFSVDGTLIQAWAGHKSFVRKDGRDDDEDRGDFRGTRRSNETHASTTDPEARLYRKGNTASELRYIGHALTDNRHGLVSNGRVTQADGHAERDAAKVMIHDARQVASSEAVVTLGGDKGYDAQEFVDTLLAMNVEPHIAQNTSGRRSAVPEAIAAGEGYAISQQKRKRIEQVFGWGKMIGGLRQVKVRGLAKVDQVFLLILTAYNLRRMRTLGQIRLQVT
ncbi:MAG: IS5 family transposase [Pseudomonadota bacterium]